MRFLERIREIEREEIKEKTLFEKKLRSKLLQKLSAASRKAGEKANNGGNSDKHYFSIRQNCEKNKRRKTVNVQTEFPLQANAVIKLRWMKRLTFPQGSRGRR